MVGSGVAYEFTPEIKYTVTIDGQASSGSDIKLGSLVKIKFESVMGSTDFFIDSCAATENSDGTGKNLTLVTDGCLGDTSTSRELIEFYLKYQYKSKVFFYLIKTKALKRIEPSLETTTSDGSKSLQFKQFAFVSSKIFFNHCQTFKFR